MTSDPPHLEIISDSNFESRVLRSETPVVLEFWADWCGACHINEPILKEMESRHRGRIKICRIDLDENSRVPGEFGIHHLPTLLFFREGCVVDRVADLIPRCELAQKIETLLATNDEPPLSRTETEGEEEQ